MRGPFAQAFVCAGIAFTLFLAGLLAVFGLAGPYAGEALGRLLFTVAVPALCTGFWASKSATTWPFLRIAITFTMIFLAVLALQAIGARSQIGPAERNMQSDQLAFGPMTGTKEAEKQPRSPASPDIQTVIRKDLMANIASCWIRPDAVPSEKPRLKLVLGRDGSLLLNPVVINSSDDPRFAPFATSAVKAVQRCAPFKDLAPYQDLYDQWREVLIDFQAG
ncbi:hypothetical protein FBZ98_11147 [Rhizobium sp. ERR 922]|nr:cell envelope integrity protein TolA [Rhizobium sp. ERR 942]TWB46726.1 hypothetical protein FBZ98_11147 [Rhizobium sp. ERR 922]TWB89159.1 hypothetical protein FBZ97_11180 [Rhizobium sp. ERR 942]